MTGFKTFIRRVLRIASPIFLAVFLLLYLYTGHIFCGGYTEQASTDFIRKYGGASEAWAVIKLIANMVPSDDCSPEYQAHALSAICSRHPEIKDGIVEYTVDVILDENKSYFNRVYLIIALESLTGESFDPSGFPMPGWGENQWTPVMNRMEEARRAGVSPDSVEFRKQVRRGTDYLKRQNLLMELSLGVGEVPEEEKPNIERGLKYIREWHEKRRASQGRQK